MDSLNRSFIKMVSFLIHSNSQFPVDVCDYIGCLFSLESSFGTSNLALDFNNYCGMKNPLVRISSAMYAGRSGEGYFWAEYSSLNSCVVDFLLCLQYHRPKSSDYDTVEHFSRFISGFYCPECDYITKINSIYSQFKLFNNER